MHGKRVLTIACTTGILVSGACFLPPPRRTLPPPPTPHLDLRGSQSIRVVITNESKTHNVDPDELRRWFVSAINESRYSGIPKARLDAVAKPHEAVLKISLTNEDASHEANTDPKGYTQWTWKVDINATLTAADGSIVWSQAGTQYQSHRLSSLSNGKDAWNDIPARNQLNYAISRSLVKQLLLGAH